MYAVDVLSLCLGFLIICYFLSVTTQQVPPSLSVIRFQFLRYLGITKGIRESDNLLFIVSFWREPTARHFDLRPATVLCVKLRKSPLPPTQNQLHYNHSSPGHYHFNHFALVWDTDGAAISLLKNHYQHICTIHRSPGLLDKKLLAI